MMITSIKSAYGNELTYGGLGVFNNYRIYGMKLNGSNNRSFYQGDFKTGINFYNWIFT